MTLQETKLDLTKRGMVLTECVTDKTPSGMIDIYVTKFDSDGLRISADAPIHQVNFLNLNHYQDELRSRGASVDNWIIGRHSKDINSCHHEEVMLNNRICCKHCMGTFGDKIVLNIGVN